MKKRFLSIVIIKHLNNIWLNHFSLERKNIMSQMDQKPKFQYQEGNLGLNN
jgi:hypothetical protein